MIEVKNIKKAFQGREILKDVSGTFKKGITNFIIGASGTGKSVLLKNIVGLIIPDQGEVLFDGRDFIQASRNERQDIRRELGMLFQASALFDSKTVEENVKFPLDMLTDMPESEKKDRVYTTLQRVGLEAAAKKMPSEISGGMKKRVGIARAIVLNPKYLFCDEPNSGLDPLTSIRIDNLIQEITREFDITTIIVSHDMNSIMEIGEYIMFLHEGRKVWEGDSENIMEADVAELQEFVFTNKLMRKFSGRNK
jgi:phospholipid/cholesterol/gamma-HCH transport system ATP-binding protein